MKDILCFRDFLLAMLGICTFRLVHLPISKQMGDRYEIANRNIFLCQRDCLRRDLGNNIRTDYVSAGRVYCADD